MFYIKGMIVSPTVKQSVDTLTANGYSENRIKELCIIYNEESLKRMALAPDGILWDYDGCVEPHIEYAQVCSLWGKMVEQGCDAIKTFDEDYRDFSTGRDEIKKNNSVTVELTPEEIKLIALGIYAAQGEGYLNDVLFQVGDYDKEETENLKVLLDKLGIGYDEKGHVYLRS